MVVDLNRVTLGRRIDEGALTVIEQIPGLVVSSDQTQALRQGGSRLLFLHYIVDACFLWIIVKQCHIPGVGVIVVILFFFHIAKRILGVLQCAFPSGHLQPERL